MSKWKIVHGRKQPTDLRSSWAAKLCECGNWFSTPNCHSARHHSCSAECLASKREAIAASGRVDRTRNCLECGKTFVARQWQLDNGIGIYCSQLCNSKTRLALLHSPEIKAKARARYMQAMEEGRICHPEGQAHPSWKGGMTINQGYVRVKAGKGYSAEHRLVAEKMIGRKLMPGEVVHHINRNRSDNRPENLEVMTASEHALEHADDPRVRNPLRGSKQPNSKLTEAAVFEIRSSAERNTALAARYGVTATLIGMVKSRKVWKHL